MSGSRRLVVGYDGSDLADQALQWAAATAAADLDPIEVLVVSSSSSVVARGQGHDASMHDAVERAEKLIASLGCAEARVEVRSGDPATVLARAGQDAAAVVVGSKGHGPVAGALLGSVSRDLAEHATSPLVVVRPAASAERRIVVGLDGHWSCFRALEFAMARAARTGSRVEAVHVVRAADPLGIEAPAGADPCRLPRLIRDTVDEAGAAHPDVALSLTTLASRPTPALVRASEDAELVVLGARGRHPFARPLLASVGQQVLHHAHCPVAIVR